MAKPDHDRDRFVAIVGAEPGGALWDRARAAWPRIALAGDAFGRRVAASGDGDPAALAELRVEDVYLATAACAGDPVALAELEGLLAPVRATLVRAGYDHALVDDGLQMVRYRLLVATPEREAKLASYRGRGSLAGWLRVVALRQVRALAGPRTVARELALADAITEGDPALAVLVRTHGPIVRRLFRDVLATLDERQRELLRLEIVDEVPHGRIAELHAVHRTTIVRWIDDARATLARELRRGLRRELGLGDDSVDSLLRALAGQLELSLASGLVPTQRT